MTRRQTMSCINLFYQKIILHVEFISALQKMFRRLTVSLYHICAEKLTIFQYYNLTYVSTDTQCPRSTSVVALIIYSYLTSS